MKRINYGRVLLGGVLAGVLMFLADGFIHEKLLHDDWMAAMQAAGRTVEAEEHGADMLYFAVFELLRGLGLAWVYAVFRSHYGPGPGTAVCAALTVWGVMFPLPFISLAPIGLLPAGMLAMWSVYELLATVPAGLLAGVVYKEAPAA